MIVLPPLSPPQEGNNKVLTVTQKKFCANGCIDGETPMTSDPCPSEINFASCVSEDFMLNLPSLPRL